MLPTSWKETERPLLARDNSAPARPAKAARRVIIVPILTYTDPALWPFRVDGLRLLSCLAWRVQPLASSSPAGGQGGATPLPETAALLRTSSSGAPELHRN